jgi:hypothetical protein
MTTTTTSPQPQQGVNSQLPVAMVTDVLASTVPPQCLRTGLESPQDLLAPWAKN